MQIVHSQRPAWLFHRQIRRPRRARLSWWGKYDGEETSRRPEGCRL